MAGERADAVRLDCDGVPFFWIEAPPPYRLTLQFRVGRADESLPAAGMTHLCEHLALAGFQGVSHGYNGRVELNRTVFVCQGSADESRRFLEETCRRLAQLPVDDLEHEKKILRVEAAGRQRGIVDAMLFDRFGAGSYGLGWLPEFGLWTVDADAVREWAGRWFTRDNAAGWMVGPEPLRARLSLPAGRRCPPPSPAPLQVTLPAVVRRAARIVGAAAIVPRSTDAVLSVGLMTKRLGRVLRYEMASAYHVLPVYLPLTAETAYVSMTSELAATRTDEAVRRFKAALEEVATRGPSAEDVDQQRAAGVASLEGHGWELIIADSNAFNELFGAARPPREELRQEYLSASADRIRVFAREMLDRVLYQIPAGLDVSLDGVAGLPPCSSWSAEGAEYEPAAGLAGPRERFVVGERGLTVWVGDKPISVAWDRTAALLCWADGGRRALGRDRFQIDVAPTRTERGRELVDAIDAHVPAALRVPLGKRMCAPFPPPIRRDPAVRARWSRQLRVNRLGAAVLMISFVTLLVQLLHDAGDGPEAVVAAVLGAGELLALGGIVAVGIAAAFAFGRRAEMSVGGGVGGVEVYDLASAHQKRLPEGVPANRSCVRGGHLLAFVVLRDLASAWFTSESGSAIDRLRRREITGPELYEQWDGVLASDMISPLGNEFLFDTLRVHPRRGSRYKRLLDRVAAPYGGQYHLPTTWEAYDRLAPLLDDELRRWRRRQLLYRLLRYVEMPPVF